MNKIVTSLLLFCMVFFLPSAGAATEAKESSTQIAVEAGKILRVTVLPQGAWVTRQVTLSTTPGKDRQLLIVGLPHGIDPANLSIRGQGIRQLAPMRLIPVSAEDTRAVRTIDRKRAELKAEQADAVDQLTAAATRLSILKTQMGRVDGKSAGAFVTDPAASKRFDQALKRILTQRQNARRQRQILQEQIDALNKERAHLIARGGKLSVETRIGSVAGSKSGRTLTLHYRVAKAGWRPIYTARLSTQENSVDWSMVADVHQQTGEDWYSVRLTLATLDNRRYYPVPKLSRWTIGFRRKTSRPLVNDRVMALAAKPKTAGESAQAQLLGVSEFNAEFHSQGAVSVASEKASTMVTLGRSHLPAQVAVRVAPQSNPLAVLTAGIQLDNKHPLPGGKLILFRDGSQVGGRHLAAIEPGQKFTLGFGVDRAVDVDFHTEPEKRDEHGLIGKSRELVRKATVTIVNHHDRQVPILVLMHLPVAIDADISVNPLPGNTSPTERRFAGLQGVWAWKLEPGAGKQAVINFGFRVRWPEDKQLSGI